MEFEFSRENEGERKLVHAIIVVRAGTARSDIGVMITLSRAAL
jgi:hypothetical protein